MLADRRGQHGGADLSAASIAGESPSREGVHLPKFEKLFLKIRETVVNNKIVCRSFDNSLL